MYVLTDLHYFLHYEKKIVVRHEMIKKSESDFVFVFLEALLKYF